MAVNSPLPGTFILNLPPAIGVTGDDQIVIVQGGTTKRLSVSLLASFINPAGTGVSVIISSGATSGSPYQVPAGVSKVLVDKTVGAATYILFNLAATYGGLPILIKDLKGDSATNNINIAFSNSELCDGLSSIVLNTNYSWIKITPYPLGGGFYVSDAG